MSLEEAGHKGMNIRVLGAHNCESQEHRFVCLLIDEVLALDAAGLTSTLSLEAQQQLKAVLVTHHHYDHVRDISALAMNLALQDGTIDIYGTRTVGEILASHLLDGRLYPKFLELPEKKPTVGFRVVEPLESELIGGYGVLAVAVNHAEDAVGYQITSPDGKAVFYTGDTGAGLTRCWEHVSPHLLIIEVTMPDNYADLAAQSGHLTPGLLKRELTSFQELKGYLPQVIVVHMNPRLEREIEAEIAVVAETLNISITLAYEGMQLQL